MEGSGNFSKLRTKRKTGTEAIWIQSPPFNPMHAYLNKACVCLPSIYMSTYIQWLFFWSCLVNSHIYIYKYIYIWPHNLGLKASLRWEREKHNFDSSIAPTMNQSVCCFWLYFSGFHFLSRCNLEVSSLPWYYSHLILCCASGHWNRWVDISFYGTSVSQQSDTKYS